MNLPLLSGALLAFSLLTAPTIHASDGGSESNSYAGLGFSQDLNIDGLLAGQVEQIEVGMFASYRGYPDLALRLADGRVFVNPDTIAYGGYQEVSEGFSIQSMTAIQGAEDAQLLMTDGSNLLRLSWTSLLDASSDRSLDPVVLPDVTLAEAELLTGEGGVLLLNDGGQSLLHLKVEPTGLSLSGEISASSAQGKFHDARLVNFSSDPARPDQLAVITNQGLELLELDGSPALYGGLPYALVGFPAGASLAVLPASISGSNRDYLLWKLTVPTIGDVIAVLNIDHFEWIFATGLGLEEFIVTTWQVEDSGEGDLVLPLAVADQVWLSNNTGATNVIDDVFEIDMEGVNQIDLGILDGEESNGGNGGIPALVRSCDMDLDGAGDLVILDSDNHLCVLPGTSSNAIGERVDIRTHVVDGVSWMDVLLPSQPATGLRYSVWWQLSPYAEGAAFPVNSDTLYAPNPGVEHEFPGVPIEYHPDGIYTIVLEPFDAGGNPLPPTVLLWATDPNRSQQMHDIASDDHPWSPPFVVPSTFTSAEDGPNGTVPVPRPRVNPLPCPEGGC